MAARALAVRELVGPRLRPVEAARGRRVLRVDGPRPRDRAPTRRTGAGNRGRRGGRERADPLGPHRRAVVRVPPRGRGGGVHLVARPDPSPARLDRRRHGRPARTRRARRAGVQLPPRVPRAGRSDRRRPARRRRPRLASRESCPVARARDPLPRVRRRCGDRPTGAPVDRVPRQQRRARPHSPAARRLRDGASRATRPRSPAASRRDHLGARGRRHRGGLHPPTGARRAPGRAHHPLRPRGQHPFPHRRPVLLPDPPVDASTSRWWRCRRSPMRSRHGSSMRRRRLAVGAP